jgi:hypothetical protein
MDNYWDDDMWDEPDPEHLSGFQHYVDIVIASIQWGVSIWVALKLWHWCWGSFLHYVFPHF